MCLGVFFYSVCFGTAVGATVTGCYLVPLGITVWGKRVRWWVGARVRALWLCHLVVLCADVYVAATVVGGVG